jgi:Zn-dependent protease
MFLVIFQQNPAAAVALLLGLVVGVVVHEAAHAYSAYLLGDDTAYRAGRVTLNPASHLDLLGSMMFLMAGFGPVAVAAAGPLSNLLIVAVCAALYHLLPPFQSGYLQIIVLLAAFGNALLFVFNLIPIPPLDGAKVIFPFLPRSLSGFVDFMNQYGPMILLVLVLLTFLPVLPSPLSYILVLVRPVLSVFGFPPIFG